MATYAIWNNKGGVGKSYLSFQIASEYARTHPHERILLLDLCPQANSSGMLLGGIEAGERLLDNLSGKTPSLTISGYMGDRIRSPYVNPETGSSYLTRVADHNEAVPGNLYLVTGDEQLEIQASRVLSATAPGPTDAWRIVHTWINDLIEDIQRSWDRNDATVFVDCNPSFTIYTELAMSAADRLIIPFSADGSSRRAVRAVLALVYGVTRQPGSQQSQFYLNSQQYRLPLPLIYCYVGNRMTQYLSSAKAFKAVVTEIGDEIWAVWQSSPNVFYVHPPGAQSPARRRDFVRMFQYEVPDANTASVVSGSAGIPIVSLTSGQRTVAGRTVTVNQSQLDRQQPNIRELVSYIE
jgi:cellulose biosynthesis protein BcsQ